MKKISNNRGCRIYIEPNKKTRGIVKKTQYLFCVKYKFEYFRNFYRFFFFRRF